MDAERINELKRKGNYINWSDLSEVDQNHIAVMVMINLIPYQEVDCGLDVNSPDFADRYDQRDANILNRLAIFRQAMRLEGLDPLERWPSSGSVGEIVDGSTPLSRPDKAMKIREYVCRRISLTPGARPRLLYSIGGLLPSRKRTG